MERFKKYNGEKYKKNLDKYDARYHDEVFKFKFKKNADSTNGMKMVKSPERADCKADETPYGLSLNLYGGETFIVIIIAPMMNGASNVMVIETVVDSIPTYETMECAWDEEAKAASYLANKLYFS